MGAAVALESDSEPAAQPAAANLPVSQTTSSVAALYKRYDDAVVEVHATTGGSQDSPFEGQSGEATGSGFVIDKEGHIVTNQHVVANAQSVQVEFSDGTEVKAEIVGTDPSTDVAVLDVDRPESDLTVLQFAPTGALEVGNPVIVLGSPFGLEGTLTTGVISAVGREIQSPNGFTIENAVQTDAALNHGNSGGPVLDTQGRVVGIAAQIRSDSGGSDGVGYAVPGDTAKRVAAALIADGKVEHAYLGVSLADDGAAKLQTVKSNSPASRRRPPHRRRRDRGRGRAGRDRRPASRGDRRPQARRRARAEGSPRIAGARRHRRARHEARDRRSNSGSLPEDMARCPAPGHVVSGRRYARSDGHG